MTRKTRRSKTAESDSQGAPGDSQGAPSDSQEPAQATPNPAVTDRDAPESHSREAAPPDTPEQAAEADAARAPDKKISLPAIGFAEDLLKKTEEDPVDEPKGDSAEPTIADSDPRRIFAFADSLARQGAQDEASAVPVRLQTWVAFSLAGEVFALPVDPVHEVVRVATITRVPHAPKPIRGVTNMRGRVIPVIDLRLRIELPSGELGRASRVIVVSSRGRLLGLLVDAVHQVIHIDLNQVQPPPDDVMTVQSDYISGVYHLEDQLILLLDINRVLIIQEAPADAVRDETPVDAVRDAEASNAFLDQATPGSS